MVERRYRRYVSTPVVNPSSRPIHIIWARTTHERPHTLMPYLTRKQLIIVVGAIGFLLFLNVFLGVGNRAEVFDLPPSFKGWVLLQFEDPACPPLTSGMWSNHWVIPESGCVCTSDAPLLRLRERRYERVNTDGNRETLSFRWHDDTSDIWSPLGLTKGPRSSDAPHKQFWRSTFFVGTKTEYESQYKGNPIGPQSPEQKICAELDGHASGKEK